MEKKMFCYQREQTDTAKLQDELTGALIALARAVDGAEIISPRTSQVILKGLFTTITNVSFDNAAIEKMIRECSRSKLLSKNLKIIVKTFREIFSGAYSTK